MEPPIVYPSKWLGETLLKGDRAETFFATLSGTREAAREALSRGLDENGLPRAVAYFQRVPFIRFEDDTLVAASPWALRAHLKGGLWARHLQQAKNQFGSKGPQIWMSAFGGLFENWCRTVAQMASAHRCFHGQVIIPKDIGVREIEDVVHLDQSEVVLFSAKASMVPEAQLRDALEAADVIAWYERFLFSEKSERYRMGALRLLDNKCTELRNRAYEPTIAHHVRVYPVLVTFDDVGDSAGMYNWVSTRCNELGLFKQPRVHCPTFMSINEYEMLMAAAAHGHSISAIMRRKVDREHSIASFSWVAHQLVPDSAHHRLPEIEALYKENNDRMSTALFGRPIRERDSKRE